MDVPEYKSGREIYRYTDMSRSSSIRICMDLTVDDQIHTCHADELRGKDEGYICCGLVLT